MGGCRRAATVALAGKVFDVVSTAVAVSVSCTETFAVDTEGVRCEGFQVQAISVELTTALCSMDDLVCL